MKAPNRLIATERGLALDLLKAGSCEHQPPCGMLERTLARVSAAGAAVASVSSLAAAETGAQLGTAAAALHTAKAVSLSAVFLKAVVIGSGIGAITIATSVGVRQVVSPALSNPVPVPSGITRAAQPRLSVAPVVASTALVESPETARPLPMQAHSSSAQSTEPSGAANPNVASLAREASLLHQAQSSLERGDADETLEIIQRYGAEFPAGQLRPEATLVRIRALVMKREDSAAERLTDELLRVAPEGTLANRTREALGHSKSR